MTTDQIKELRTVAGVWLQDAGEEAYRLHDAIGDAIPTDEDESARRVVGRLFLAIPCLLARQITSTVSEGRLYLALLGVRALIEHEINAKFIFNHPVQGQDADRQKALSKEFLAGGGLSSKLGGRTVKQRAEDCLLTSLYDTSYSSLSKYVHRLTEPSALVRPEILSRHHANALVDPLVRVHNIKEAVCTAFRLTPAPELERTLLALTQLADGLGEISQTSQA